MSILERLYVERVFSTHLRNEKTECVIEEACDCFFEVRLTKAEMLTLADEIKELAERMEYEQ